MRVFIALATFNGAGFIADQLRSLTGQRHLPYELVVCDDRSTDDTVAIVEDFAVDAPFDVSVVVNPDRLGYRANFMKAAGLCRGDLVAFCDQDDVWHPEKLAEVVRRFDDPAVMLVHHNARLVGADGQAFGRVHGWSGIRDTDDGPMAASPWRFPQGFAMTFRPALLALSELRDRSVDPVQYPRFALCGTEVTFTVPDRAGWLPSGCRQPPDLSPQSIMSTASCRTGRLHQRRTCDRHRSAHGRRAGR